MAFPGVRSSRHASARTVSKWMACPAGSAACPSGVFWMALPHQRRMDPFWWQAVARARWPPLCCSVLVAALYPLLYYLLPFLAWCLRGGCLTTGRE